MTAPNTVQATLEFIVPPSDGSLPFYNINSEADGTRKINYHLEKKQVNVENVRGKEKDYNLDNAGFQFFRKPTETTDFSVDEDVEKHYYPECVQILKELTGANRVVLFDHTIRRRRLQLEGAEDNPQQRQPVVLAHVDQTPKAAVARVHRHLPPAEAPALAEKRFQIINLWRPITNIALDWPLAVCDFRSVDKDRDAIAVSLVYPNREPGEIYNIRYNPDHQWKYLRGMETDEGVLIKCFDNLRDGSVALLTPHTAFEDPSTPADAPFRESIEVRALVFYD